HSTALGGLVVAELNHQGAKTLGKIYLGDTLTAEHGESWGSGWVEWKHEDPVTGQRGVSDAIRYYVADDAILDPTGINIGPPTLLYPEEGAADERAPVALYGSGIPNGRCMWDGITVDCAEVERVHDWTRSL
ncbi:MAG: hypothetical protein ACRD68_14300, partial [Pyrinomonadaceae bacterium]